MDLWQRVFEFVAAHRTDAVVTGLGSLGLALATALLAYSSWRFAKLTSEATLATQIAKLENEYNAEVARSEPPRTFSKSFTANLDFQGLLQAQKLAKKRSFNDFLKENQYTVTFAFSIIATIVGIASLFIAAMSYYRPLPPPAPLPAASPSPAPLATKRNA